MRIALDRAAVLYALWMVLIRSVQPADLVVGAAAVALATWWSLRLLPPDEHPVRMAALVARLPRFLWQSARSGVAVARLAFAPRLRLAPGFVTYPTSLPRGHARNTYAAVTSLLPGTVPVDDIEEGLVYHCLDTAQPVLEELAAEERAYAPALRAEAPHG